MGHFHVTDGSPMAQRLSMAAWSKSQMFVMALKYLKMGANILLSNQFRHSYM